MCPLFSCGCFCTLCYTQYGSLPYFDVYVDPKSPPQVESSSITAPVKQTQGVDFGTIAVQVRLPHAYDDGCCAVSEIAPKVRIL